MFKSALSRFQEKLMTRISLPQGLEIQSHPRPCNLRANKTASQRFAFGASTHIVSVSTAQMPNRPTCSNARSTRRTPSGECESTRPKS